MAGFGGTIKLTGESQYRAALSNIAAQLRSVGTQMEVVTAASTGNEKSLTNLTAKNNVLGDTLDLHKQKLNVLGQQYEKLQQKQQENKKRSAELAAQLGDEQAKLADTAIESSRDSEAYQKQSAVVAKLTASYDKSQTAIITTGTAMAKCTAQMHQTELGVVKTQQAIDALAPDLHKAEKETLALGRQYDLTGKIAGIFKAQIAAIKGVIPGMVSGVKNAATSVKTMATNMANSVKSVGTFVSSTKQAAAAADGFKAKVGAVASSIGGAMANGINTAAGSVVRLVDHFKRGAASASELGDAAAKSGKDAEASSEGYTVVKNVLANLATGAIQSALGALKQLGASLVDVGKQAFAQYSSYEQLTGGVQKLFGTSGMTLEQYAASVGQTVEQAKAKYDQLDAAQTAVMNNAKAAYQTAGLSANEYMDTVTKFSASLIQSLGGDTQKAADYADRAVRDMADNANKMGTNIQDIQNAYQGFAKDNYTMLDNLRLGFGGTKAEASRLVEEASKMTDIQQKLDVTVDGSSLSFDNLVNAIHVMQENLGIAGTTTAEASGTIEGSVNSMKAAWTNLLTAMGSGEDLQGNISTFVATINTAASNVIPRVKEIAANIGTSVTSLVNEVLPQVLSALPGIINDLLPSIMSALNAVISAVLVALPQLMDSLNGLIPTLVSNLVSMMPQLVAAGMQMLTSLINGIVEALPQLMAALPVIITNTVTVITTNLPQLIQAGVELIVALVNGLVQAMPQLIAMIPTIISSVSTVILANLPLIIAAGVQLLVSLITGIVQAIPQLVAMLPTIITQIVDTLMANLPLILEAGITILLALIDGITKSMPQLIAMLPTIIMTIVKTLTNHLPEIISMGVLIIAQLVAGLVNSIPQVVKGIGMVIKSLLGALHEVPGQVVEIGKNIIQGLWKGIESVKDWLKGKISGIADWIPGWIKDKLGIHSPSKVMRDQVGKYIAQGIGVGFEDEMSQVKAQMIDAMPSPDAFAQDYSFGAVNAASSGYRASWDGSQSDIVSAITEALKGVQVVLDDEVAGRFVTKTVTAAIYR